MAIQLNMFVENIIYLGLLYGDGTIDMMEPPESLMDKSHRTKSKQPKAHTDMELKWIKKTI